jgi:NAD(P)-dependent dehydrogenase (short-subunit alcohol dehydrogenase family)
MLHVGGVDLANTQAGARLAHATRDHLAGRAFAVANCVGSFPGYRGITEIDGNSAASVLRDNLLAVYNTAHALLPLMRDAGGGHFVAFTSHSRYQAYPLMAAFDAAKAGVVQLVRHIANEEARHRVFANALALATLLTDAERRMKPHGDHAAWLRPEQVAEALFWLVGAPASAVNGNELHLFNYSESYFHASYFDRINGHGSLNDGASG